MAAEQHSVQSKHLAWLPTRSQISLDCSSDGEKLTDGSLAASRMLKEPETSEPSSHLPGTRKGTWVIHKIISDAICLKPSDYQHVGLCTFWRFRAQHSTTELDNIARSWVWTPVMAGYCCEHELFTPILAQHKTKPLCEMNHWLLTHSWCSMLNWWKNEWLTRRASL